MIVRVASGDPVLKALKDVKNPLFTIEVKSTSDLPTGDIALYHEEKLIMLLERKTNADLLSSLGNSNRYKQQVSRLMEVKELNPEAHIGFLIEHGRNGVADEKVLHVITSLVFKYKLFVIQVADMAGTAMVVNDAAKKIGFECDTSMHSVNASGGTAVMKKKVEYLHENFFAHQLALVNGVSLRIAQSIVNEYKTFSNLWEAWQLSSDPENMLASRVTTVGNALSAKIYCYMTGKELQPKITRAKKKKVETASK